MKSLIAVSICLFLSIVAYGQSKFPKLYFINSATQEKDHAYEFVYHSENSFNDSMSVDIQKQVIDSLLIPDADILKICKQAVDLSAKSLKNPKSFQLRHDKYAALVPQSDGKGGLLLFFVCSFTDRDLNNKTKPQVFMGLFDFKGNLKDSRILPDPDK